MIDAHCHLTWPDFDDDRAAMLDRARAAGVTAMIAIGPGRGMTGNHDAIALAEAHADVYAAVGIHPHDADLWTPAIADQIAQLARHPRVVAIGEIGLDHHYTHATHDHQRAAFHAQMDLALAIGKPIQIHQRDATDTMFACFRERTHLPRGIIHCFTGSGELAEQFLAFGFALSIPGVVTFKKCDDVRAMVARIPLDQLLLETDCPYLAPVPHRGKRCEPGFMVETAKTIAGLHGMTLEELVARTDDNTRTLFGLPTSLHSHS